MNPTGQTERLDCAIVTFHFPPQVGGIENYLLRLATALKRRISVEVLAASYSGSPEVDDALGFPVHRRPMLAGLISRRERLFKPLYPLLWLLVLVRTFRTFRRSRPRVLCSGSADFGVAVALAAALIGSRFTFICYGKDVHVSPHLYSRVSKGWPNRWIMSRSCTYFVISDFTRNLIDPTGEFSDKTQLLRVPIGPPPAKPEVVRLASEAAALIDSAFPGVDRLQRRIVLSVGRLRERKGFQHVIQGMAQIRSAHPDAVYVIVGAGNFEQSLRKEAQTAGVSDRVFFAGRQGVSHEPLHGFYSLADVFVTVTWAAPGDPEGFGMVFVEAGTLGTPSISGNIGGMSEAVLDGKTGINVPGASPPAIAAALDRLLSDAELRGRMGRAARQHARLYEPDRVAAVFIRRCGLAAESSSESRLASP